MRKMFALSIVALSISAVSVYGIVKKSNAIWETVDVQQVYGGCFQYNDVLQCGGGTATCGDTLCGVVGGTSGPGNYICPAFGYDSLIFAHRRISIRTREYYYPGVKPVESAGKTDYVSAPVECLRNTECAATSCVPGAPGVYYCSEDTSASVPENVEHYTLSGSGC